MTKEELANDLKKVQKIASLSKIKRLLHNPFKYGYAIAYRELIYPKKKKEKIVETTLFYGDKMKVALPASTDIYLTGGKSHSSEIRLALFLILNLKQGNHFLDIGAHYGYFTLVASKLVGDNGSIYSFEPSDKSFNILSQNASRLKTTSIFKKAISDTTEKIIFYEFANLQSEYNSSDIKQFENEEWYQNTPPLKIEVEATTIDKLTQQTKFTPNIIKIDVEGAEYNVIKGGMNYLTSNSPKIVMEYLEPKRNNESHKKALNLLREIGYTSYIINGEGALHEIDNIDQYLETANLESDNIVFVKK